MCCNNVTYLYKIEYVNTCNLVYDENIKRSQKVNNLIKCNFTCYFLFKKCSINFKKISIFFQKFLKGEDTGIEVSLIDVYNEFSEKVAEKYKIPKFKSKVEYNILIYTRYMYLTKDNKTLIYTSYKSHKQFY